MTEHGTRRKKHIRLQVNGKGVEAEIDNRTTLAEFLRERLDLTGTKVGCNRGECGSCTVILDGNAVYSCTVLAVEAAGKQIMAVFVDIYGNEARELIRIERFTNTNRSRARRQKSNARKR